VKFPKLKLPKLKLKKRSGGEAGGSRFSLPSLPRLNGTDALTIVKIIVPWSIFIFLFLAMFVNGAVKDWMWSMLGATYPLWVAIVGYWCWKKNLDKTMAYFFLVLGFGMMIFYAAHPKMPMPEDSLATGNMFKDCTAQNFMDEFFHGEIGVWANGGLPSVVVGTFLGTWFSKGFGIFVALLCIIFGTWCGFGSIKRRIERKLDIRLGGSGRLRGWLQEMLGRREVEEEDDSDWDDWEPPERVVEGVVYTPPSLEFLTVADTKGVACGEKGVDIERAFSVLGVKARTEHTNIGPTVGMFELSVEDGHSTSKLKGLENDLAMKLGSERLRIQAPIPGTSCIGVEVPNETRGIVGLKNLISGGDADNVLELPLGRDSVGNPYYINLKELPHLLVAGSTGSGKSICIHTLIMGILFKASYMDVKLILVDPKETEFAFYEGIPHLKMPVVKETSEAVEVFRWAAEEMDRRNKILGGDNPHGVKARDIDKYRAKGYHMERIVIFVEEFADLMQTSGKAVEEYIQRLSQKGRSAGIHMVMATQRPDSNTVKGPIKTNFTGRIALKVGSNMDSRVILDQGGAEKLLGNGDMLYSKSCGTEPVRIQGCLIEEEEIEDVVRDVIDKNPVSEDEEPMAISVADDLLEDARMLIIQKRKASAKMLVDELGIGTPRANKLLKLLEKEGVIGPSRGNGRGREVLVK